MCNDLVYCFDPEEPEDRQINKVSAVRVEYNEGAIKFEQFTDWFEEGWFEPIPLTPEILEKNGFVLHSQCGYQYTENVNDLFSFRFSVGGLFQKQFAASINGRVIKLNYVHELQHCLRLCRLNELADSIII